jgi:eukaryotic-like serine/threonine-protein kinase
LLDGLASLESRECVHGDIRLTNVRLTAGGTAVLVDAGITPSVSPELIINARTRPERYDGIAPELIGTGASQNSQSEMYALGCLLWQLLAGRPPYPTGDPLAKLALHQTRRLVDVREWAPDTPAKLAELIFELTQPAPDDRPVSFAELREKHGNSGRSSRRRLAQFHASLHTQVRTRRSTGRVMWWSTVATLLFVLSGLAVTLVDKGLRNQLLQITAPMTNYLDETLDRYRSDSPPSENPDIQTTPKKAISIVSNALPIPPPNAQGEITLTTNGPYRWDSRIDAVGSIVVKASAGKSPVIFVAPGKCRIFADQVRLENVHFQLLESETQSPAFILVNARNLSISQCSFQPRAFAEKKPQTAIAKLAASVIFWTPHSTNTRNGERLNLKDTISRGPLDFLALGAAPKQIIANNCLKLGGGRLLRFIKPARAGRNCNIRLEHTTLRNAASLLRLDTGNGRTAAGTIELDVANCVFDFDSQKGAMFHLSGNLNTFRDPLIRISGVGSVSQPNFKIAKKIGLSGTISQLSNTDQWVLFEGGILTAPFQFSGPADEQPTSSLVNVQGIPRRSTGGPGINAKPLTLK